MREKERERAGRVGATPKWEMEAFRLAYGVSYVGQDGRNGRSCGHSLDTGKV